MVKYDVKINVTYGCSAADFQSALNNFDGFRPFQISVVRNIYDGSNNSLSSLTGAARVDYVVSFYVLRAATYST